MSKRHTRIKILCIVAAGLATLLLAILQAGNPEPYTMPVSAGQQPERQDPAADENNAKDNLNSTVNTIKDIENWNHPAKPILLAAGITIQSVELLKDGTYLVFYVTFPFDLTSENEARMTEIIDKVAKANSWWDFELVDNALTTRIKVICDRQYNMVDDVVINGDRNYFVRLNQDRAAENYSYIKPIEMKREGKLLKLLSQGAWQRKVLTKAIGDGDSFFDGYEIYFDKGLSVKYSNDRIYNIVFNNRYKDTVIKGIAFGYDRSRVVKLLGEPQFEASEKELYGYKFSDYYIFFSGADSLKEISIYSRNTGYKKDTLARLLEKYGTEKDGIDLDSFINDLKLQWPNYDLYYSERGGLGMSYDSVGVEINNMYQDRGGPYITIYGNFEGSIDSTLELPEKLDGLMEYSSDFVLLKLDIDSIFAAEKERLNRTSLLDSRRSVEGVLSPDGSMKIMSNDGGTFEHAGLFVFSMDGKRPDTELHTGHFPGKMFWIDNRYFIYDVSMLGVFMYDTKDKKVIDVLPSNLEKGADYELDAYEAGVATIKNLTDNTKLTRKFVPSPDGTVSIEK